MTNASVRKLTVSGGRPAWGDVMMSVSACEKPLLAVVSPGEDKGTKVSGLEWRRK